MTQAYGLWREDRGYSRRAIVILDREGTVRHCQVIERGAPDVEAMLQVVKAVVEAA